MKNWWEIYAACIHAVSISNTALCTKCFNPNGLLRSCVCGRITNNGLSKNSFRRHALWFFQKSLRRKAFPDHTDIKHIALVVEDCFLCPFFIGDQGRGAVGLIETGDIGTGEVAVVKAAKMLFVLVESISARICISGIGYCLGKRHGNACAQGCTIFRAFGGARVYCGLDEVKRPKRGAC